MKQLLLVLIVLFMAAHVHGQHTDTGKIHVWAEVSSALSRPGITITYNRRIGSYWAYGAGVSLMQYKPFYHIDYPSDQLYYRPSVFLEIKETHYFGSSAIYGFLQLGFTYYKFRYALYAPPEQFIYTTSNATYSCFGVGYMLRLKKVKMAPFFALKAVGNSYVAATTQQWISPLPQKEYSGIFIPAVSVGIRF